MIRYMMKLILREESEIYDSVENRNVCSEYFDNYATCRHSGRNFCDEICYFSSDYL